MGQDRNIVHQYFRRDIDGLIILVKVNPIQFNGTEITVQPDGKVQVRHLDFDEDILEDLRADGFSAASPIAFNLYLAGLC